jgi:CDP-6-deoxy-D-xylo-4-hexulose-3-dehydrase
LLLPQTIPGADPSWFGFLMTLRDGAPVTRNQLAEHLERNNIQTRNLFAGNLTRHPCFDALKEGTDYRIAVPLTNTDRIMNDSLWVGVYSGMGQAQLAFMLKTIQTAQQPFLTPSFAEKLIK